MDEINPENVRDLRDYLIKHPPNTEFSVLDNPRFWVLGLKYEGSLRFYFRWRGQRKRELAEISLEFTQDAGCSPEVTFYREGMLTASFLSPEEIGFLMKNQVDYTRKGMVVVPFELSIGSRMERVKIKFKGMKKDYLLPSFSKGR
jgi:hypothetical protein